MSDFSDYEDEEGVDEPDLDAIDKKDDAAVVEKPLTQEIISTNGCLSLLCKTGNSLAHAYVRLDIKDREITDISCLKVFVHLRYIDLSGNKISDLSPLNHLTHLLTVKADKNLVTTAKLNELPYLQILNCSNNKVQSLEGIGHPLLETLNLNGNEISDVSRLSFNKLARLTQLELKANKLTSTAGIHLPGLRKLYLGDNSIVNIEQLSRLQNLTILHLRNNKITSLDGFPETLTQLQYLNLRKNEVTTFSEVEKLKRLPMLRALILRQNPVCYEESYRIEVLVLLRRLERLDQDVYVEDERQEAEEIYNSRQEMENQGEETGNHEVIQSEEED